MKWSVAVDIIAHWAWSNTLRNRRGRGVATAVTPTVRKSERFLYVSTLLGAI